MIRKWLALCLFACAFNVSALQDTVPVEASSSHYISDDLFIFMHTGPSRNYRILGSIQAGSPISVLESNSETGFTKVKDGDDREGWVESKFVSTTMSQAEQLPILTEQLAQSQTSLQAAQRDNARLRQQLNESRQQVSTLTQQSDEQLSEISVLNEKVASADKDEMMMWFTRGGMVAGAGILLGVILTYLPKRKRRSNEWM